MKLFLVSTKEHDGQREYWETRPAVRAKDLFDLARRLRRDLKDVRVEAVSQEPVL